MDDFYRNIPPEYTTPMASYGEERQTRSVLKELSPQENLKEMVKWLKGELWDEKQQRYVKVEEIKPLMNEEGRNIFFHQATSLLSSINTQSNYSKDYKTIHNIINMHVKRASAIFHLHYKDFGISHKTYIGTITDKLLTLGLSALYKAIGAGDRNAGTRNIHESISNISREMGGGFGQQVPMQRGFLARMNPFAR